MGPKTEWWAGEGGRGRPNLNVRFGGFFWPFLLGSAKVQLGSFFFECSVRRKVRFGNFFSRFGSAFTEQ